MKFCNRLVAIALLIASFALAAPVLAGPTCHGRFMNPITDICWSCVFPLTIGAASLLSGGQVDIGNPSTPICYCNNPPRIGVSIGFWEPVRLVDVTRTPFCMVGLGGIA
ncbi:MAG: TraU family protein, partial [Burkholderiales bacterium]|nr:TraU family protein [Burkholderiales bacterium]